MSHRATRGEGGTRDESIAHRGEKRQEEVIIAFIYSFSHNRQAAIHGDVSSTVHSVHHERVEAGQLRRHVLSGLQFIRRVVLVRRSTSLISTDVSLEQAAWTVNSRVERL